MPTTSKGPAWVAFLVAVATYTPTNVAFLSILAGLLGGCASLLLYGYPKVAPAGNVESANQAADEERLAFLTEHPMSSALRGFAAYLTFLAGTLVASGQPFAQTSADEYARMAGVVAILAFAVGYDPTIFQQLLRSFPPKR